MRTIIFMLASLVCIFVMAFSGNDPVPLGSPLPKGEIKMKDISGKEISLKKKECFC